MRVGEGEEAIVANDPFRRGRHAVQVRANPLVLGLDQGLMTALEDGLAPCGRLVVRGQRELRDGSLVAVREEASAMDGSTADDPVEIRAAEAFEPLRVAREREPGGDR